MAVETQVRFFEDHKIEKLEKKVIDFLSSLDEEGCEFVDIKYSSYSSSIIESYSCAIVYKYPTG